MSNRTQISLILLCVAAAGGFAGYQIFQASGQRTYRPSETFTQRTHLTDFSENGVSVDLFLETDSQGRPLLRATFTPEEAGFHLYGKDLDVRKVQGAATPIGLKFMPRAGIKLAGPSFTDVAPTEHTVAEISSPIPVYPDGPVTLRLPIEMGQRAGPILTQVAISYQTCAMGGVCRQPVENHVVDVSIPVL